MLFPMLIPVWISTNDRIKRKKIIGMTQSPEKYTIKKLINKKYQQFSPDTLIKIIKIQSSKLKENGTRKNRNM